MKNLSYSRLVSSFALCALLAACGHTGGGGGGNNSAFGPSPANGSYKVGQPYQINGDWYYPKEDYSYDETGVASWYGDDFHEQRTANGEIFNKNELTAAHKTLPLPTLARITNLDNGRSIVVRINDRGPFSGTRLIDVSQRSAQLLGFESQGTAKVRVQVLADESKAIADAMRHYGGNQVASAAPEPLSAAPIAPVSEQPAPQSANAIASAPVQSETLAPIRTTPEVHQQLLATKPVAEAVQLPITGSHQLYVQAGAFTVEGNAVKLQQSLAKFGPTSISNVTINGTKFYRVRLGPVSDVPHADALLNKVRQSGQTGARTVVE